MIDAGLIREVRAIHRKAQLALWHVEEKTTLADVERKGNAQHLADAYKHATDCINQLTNLNALIAQNLNA